jgi:hypothetical protein
MAGMADIIDALILNVLHMPVTDAEDPARRERCLQLAQEIVDEFCHEDFRWMKNSGDVQALAADGGANTLPVDFMELGPEGYVKQIGQETPLVERPYQEIVHAQETEGPTGILTRFALGAVQAGSGIKLLTDRPSVDLDLVVYYKATPPVLTDANPGGLNAIPAAYHYTVVYNGVKWRLLDEEGDDARAAKAESKYEEGRARAIKVERRNKTTVTQLPKNAAGHGMY